MRKIKLRPSDKDIIYDDDTEIACIHCHGVSTIKEFREYFIGTKPNRQDRRDYIDLKHKTVWKSPNRWYYCPKCGRMIEVKDLRVVEEQ